MHIVPAPSPLYTFISSHGYFKNFPPSLPHAPPYSGPSLAHSLILLPQSLPLFIPSLPHFYTPSLTHPLIFTLSPHLPLPFLPPPLPLSPSPSPFSLLSLPQLVICMWTPVPTTLNGTTLLSFKSQRAVSMMDHSPPPHALSTRHYQTQPCV